MLQYPDVSPHRDLLYLPMFLKEAEHAWSREYRYGKRTGLNVRERAEAAEELPQTWHAQEGQGAPGEQIPETGYYRILCM